MIEPYKFGKEYEFKVYSSKSFLNKLVERDASGPNEVRSSAYEWGLDGLIRAMAFECGLINLAGADVLFDYYVTSEYLEQKGNHFHFSYYCPNNRGDVLFSVNTFTTIGLILRYLLASRNRFRNVMKKYTAQHGLCNASDRILDLGGMGKYCFTNVVEAERRGSKFYVHLEFRASEFSVIYDYALVDFIIYLINKLYESDCSLIKKLHLLMAWTDLFTWTDAIMYRKLKRIVMNFVNQRIEDVKSETIPEYVTYQEFYENDLLMLKHMLSVVYFPEMLPCFYLKFDDIIEKELEGNFGVDYDDVLSLVYLFNAWFEKYGFRCDVYEESEGEKYLIFWGNLSRIEKFWLEYFEELRSKAEKNEKYRLLADVHSRALMLLDLNILESFYEKDEKSSYKYKLSEVFLVYNLNYELWKDYISDEIIEMFKYMAKKYRWSNWVGTGME